MNNITERSNYAGEKLVTKLVFLKRIRTKILNWMRNQVKRTNKETARTSKRTKERKIHDCMKMLYSHMLQLYIYMLNGSQRHNDKGRAKSSLTKYIPLILL